MPRRVTAVQRAVVTTCRWLALAAVVLQVCWCSRLQAVLAPHHPAGRLASESPPRRAGSGATVPRRRRRDDRGQATTEYALVLLGAAMVALLLVAWATSGGGAGRIGRLLDRVLDTVTSRV
jgi:Flp pilus assembly pilin Flp